MKRTVETNLKAIIAGKVRFSETDSMSVVWHGNYIRFLEDAREAFGEKYGISYNDIFSAGYYVPLVSVKCDYRASLRYGDEFQTEITYRNTLAAKIVFNYIIRNAATGSIAATGETIQVFVTVAGNELCLGNPSFFEQWKQKWLP